MTEADRLIARQHANPHAYLGAHPENGSVVIRTFRPAAAKVEVVTPDGGHETLECVHPGGVFEGKLEGVEPPVRYQLEVDYGDSGTITIDDPYRFLPTLGERFLEELYRSLTAQPGAVTIVAENGAGIVGFAAGTRSVPEAYRRFGRSRAVRAAIAAAPRLIRPSVLRRAWETARYAPTTEGLPEAELLSIGVDRAARGRGLGLRLSRELLSNLAAIGVD